jgi:hypothetical protein
VFAVNCHLQVLTNEDGISAALLDRSGLFDLVNFYISNPNRDTGLTVVLYPTVRTVRTPDINAGSDVAI